MQHFGQITIKVKKSMLSKKKIKNQATETHKFILFWLAHLSKI